MATILGTEVTITIPAASVSHEVSWQGRATWIQPKILTFAGRSDQPAGDKGSGPGLQSNPTTVPS